MDKTVNKEVKTRTMFLSRHYMRDLSRDTRATVYLYKDSAGVDAIPIEIPLVPSSYWTEEEQELDNGLKADFATAKKRIKLLEDENINTVDELLEALSKQGELRDDLRAIDRKNPRQRNKPLLPNL